MKSSGTIKPLTIEQQRRKWLDRKYEEWKGWYEIFIRFACVVIVSMISFKKSVFI